MPSARYGSIPPLDLSTNFGEVRKIKPGLCIRICSERSNRNKINPPEAENEA